MKWEYKITEHWWESSLEREMQEMGNLGWEAFHIQKEGTSGRAKIYYKKPRFDDFLSKIK